jgi:hypothetical protein
MHNLELSWQLPIAQSCGSQYAIYMICIFMPFTFSSTKFADMVYIYWLCNENMSAAAKYTKQFPSERLLYQILFSNTFHKECSAASSSSLFPSISTSAELVA